MERFLEEARLHGWRVHRLGEFVVVSRRVAVGRVSRAAGLILDGDGLGYDLSSEQQEPVAMRSYEEMRRFLGM